MNNPSDFLNFFEQTQEIIRLTSHLDNLDSIYHYSVPNIKLFYPEPFIASASFMHSDI